MEVDELSASPDRRASKRAREFTSSDEEYIVPKEGLKKKKMIRLWYFFGRPSDRRDFLLAYVPMYQEAFPKGKEAEDAVLSLVYDGYVKRWRCDLQRAGKHAYWWGANRNPKQELFVEALKSVSVVS